MQNSSKYNQDTLQARTSPVLAWVVEHRTQVREPRGALAPRDRRQHGPRNAEQERARQHALRERGYDGRVAPRLQQPRATCAVRKSVGKSPQSGLCWA